LLRHRSLVQSTPVITHLRPTSPNAGSSIHDATLGAPHVGPGSALWARFSRSLFSRLVMRAP
jgi:hypothetical protein